MASTSFSPVTLVRPDSVIRLTGYRAAGDARQRLIEAWRSQKPEPYLYAELNEQVVEWNQLAAREIDQPISFDLLEYAILPAATSLAPALQVRGVEAVSGVYRVDFRLLGSAAGQGEESSALMFNLFEVQGSPGMQQGFLMNWPPRGMFRMQLPGMRSSMLHERLLPSAPFLCFNRAELTDAATYAAGIDRFEQAFPRSERKRQSAPGESVTSHLGLFRMVARLGSSQVPAAKTMKAARADDYGAPDVLRFSEAPLPEPGPGQIRVRVRAVSINPLDVKMRSGEVREIYPSWFPDTFGYSVSGIVDALGPGTTGRTLGEEVYGNNNPIMRGGYAEYVIGPAEFYYPRPRNLSFAVAAAAPAVFATAHGALFGRANLQPGQTVLIHGGAGVIGSCAVQLAHAAGAHVIATASSRDRDGVLALGAERVIDYRNERFEDLVHDIDLVVDTVGGETRDRSWQVLRKGGTLASLLPPEPDQQTAAQHQVQAFMVHGHPKIGEILPEMTRRLETGALQPPEIAATFPLQQAADAHAAYERQTPRGRIVLTVD